MPELPDAFRRLIESWQAEAELFRKRGQEPAAAIAESYADELEAAWDEWQLEALTLEGLLPGGRATGKGHADKPWGGWDDSGSSTAIEKLHEAEKTLGVAYVKGRAYHGIKRAHVTVSWELSGGDAAKVGDLTGNTSPGILRRHYRKAKTPEKVAHMRRVRARFEGSKSEEAVPEAVPPEGRSA